MVNQGTKVIFVFMIKKLVMTIIIVIAFSLNIFSQNLIISGNIKDEDTKEAVPFANVWIKGTLYGIQADINGDFTFSSPITGTLCISSIGYFTKEISLKKEQKDLIILLKEDVKTLEEVIIKPEVSRAKVLFKRILDSKDENHDKILATKDFKTFARTTVFVAIDSTSNANKYVDNLDELTIELENQNLKFSPIYLAEQAEDHKHDNSKIVYSKQDGIFPKLNQSIESLILINVVVDLDFYKDQINMLGRGLTSPISSSSRLVYDIFLNDSTFIDSVWHYNFSFVPKNKYNALFTGNFTVEGENYALTEINAYIQEEANINFVNGFKAKVSYKKTEPEAWFYNEQQISLNLALTLNKDTSNYDSQRVHEISNGNWLINKTTQYSTSDRLDKIKAKDWEKQPEFESNLLAENTYQQVDKLKENSIVRSIDAIGGAVLSSYINTGEFDIGPVFDIYSSNAIEGNRYTIPLRTSQQMFDYFSVGGFLGYGTKNEEFKYGMNIAYQPLPTDKFIFRLSYSEDYTLVSQDKYLRFIKKNPNTRGNGNFIAAVTSRELNPYLKEETGIELKLEYNAEKNFGLELTGYYLHNINTPQVRFIHNNIDYHSYINYGMLINCRLDFGQHYDKYYFYRVYYLEQTPVVNISIDIGQTKLPDKSISESGLYLQLHSSISGRFNWGQTYVRYMINGGCLMGDAPYELLDMPVGSMSLGFAKYRYNLLHQAAFAHNIYTNIHLDYTMGGIFLNHIPLIKHLKLREIVSFKAHYGSLNNSYNGVFDLPNYYSNDINRPYTEIGVGLTNIFKILRVEYIHQFDNTFINSGFTDKNGIRFRVEMSF